MFQISKCEIYFNIETVNYRTKANNKINLGHKVPYKLPIRPINNNVTRVN